ncbi:uncharacterized protein LTR77_002332 [Saxophila tyrrhenica]|uniref:DUF427 domain-containing protein n=1 Tax=Saxophila tyrrhenica TaxID=1690608 RepID=A0AAV9PMX7_9PEZI|nr:hypothetical protein LTR77_002332 [Saxophila tyrrhenica]
MADDVNSNDTCTHRGHILSAQPLEDLLYLFAFDETFATELVSSKKSRHLQAPSISSIKAIVHVQRDVRKIALKLGTDGPVKTLPTPRKVQILFGGTYIIRTTNAHYVWEHPFFPQLYLPLSELVSSSKAQNFSFTPGSDIKSDSGHALATQYTIACGSKTTDQVIAFSDNLTGKPAELSGLVKINFDSMDQWFEEDTPIHVHPKDPFKRIDILASTRPIKVSVSGRQIAYTETAMHLYETGLPARFYIPLTSIDPTVLRPSSTRTKCPYKGEAEYYSVEIDGEVHEDLFWYYTRPTVESSKVEGLVCPYNERVDIELEGKKLERPKTHFGKPKEGKKPEVV